MAKDRLGDLIKARDGRNGNVQVEIQEETEPLVGGDNLRQTFERADVLRQWIESIEENIDAIRQYVKRIDDIKTNQRDLSDKIESLFQNNTSISQKIQAKLKEFEEEIKTADTSSAEGRIKNIQFSTLKTRYQKVFKQNTSELENYRNIKKSQLESQLIAKGVKVTDDELSRLLDEGTDIQVFTENILAETAEAKRVLQDLEDRHQQLLKIENMLVEVRDLFLQMSILIDNQAHQNVFLDPPLKTTVNRYLKYVQELIRAFTNGLRTYIQQELIDRVEYQAEMAQNFVGKGREDLKSGREKRCKFLKKKIILLVLLVVLIAIIIALIFK